MHFIPQLCVAAALTTLFAGCQSANSGRVPGIILTSPAHRIVYQRGLDGTARLTVAGSAPSPRARLEARLVPVNGSAAQSPWQSLRAADDTGAFLHNIQAPSGWHRLEVRLKGHPKTTAVVERLGVGEVFIVVGHSVAHGGRTNLPGAVDDRVNTIAWPASSSEKRQEYERTANPSLLPPLLGTPFTNNVHPAPFGHGTYFWSRFAEHIAERENVPVLLLNAAFGGTSLEHWSKSARGEKFEHSFVRSHLRMPYINLHHALREYAAHTGVRAILADQGQNDWPEPDANKVFTNYLAFVNQARADANCSELAVVVNRQTGGGRTQIRRAQERMLRDVPHTFPGPDYDTLAKADRYDGIHLSAEGLPRAAKLWADALTPQFFQTVRPCLPRAGQ